MDFENITRLACTINLNGVFILYLTALIIFNCLNDLQLFLFEYASFPVCVCLATWAILFPRLKHFTGLLSKNRRTTLKGLNSLFEQGFLASIVLKNVLEKMPTFYLCLSRAVATNRPVFRISLYVFFRQCRHIYFSHLAFKFGTRTIVLWTNIHAVCCEHFLQWDTAREPRRSCDLPSLYVIYIYVTCFLYQCC